MEAKDLSNNSISRVNKSAMPDFESSGFRSQLLHWYRGKGRQHLPWRLTHDPYHILVSEFMLQQTPVATVLPRYHDWLQRFPDLKSVARGSEHKILLAWQGLGYYSRALNLRATAKIVTTRYHGYLPSKIDQLTSLPGIGRYTANAIASFAFNRAVPVVDANIARVIARLFDLAEPIDTAAGLGTVWTKARMLLPRRGSRDYNSALMDLGALVCIARQPKCNCCPVQRFCRAQNPNILPVKKPRPAFVQLTEYHSFNLYRGRVLLERSRKRWRGMWILPRLTNIPSKRRLVQISMFPFTHHRITLAIYPQHGRPSLKPGDRELFSLSTLDNIPMPSPHRRALTKLLARRSQKLCSSFPRA